MARLIQLPPVSDDEDELPPVSAPPSTISSTSLRIHPVTTSSMPPPAVEPVVRALVDVLLGAALTDGELSHKERHAVRQLIATFVAPKPTPAWVERRIRNFDPDEYDVAETVSHLRSLSTPEKRHIVELARRLCEADNAYDLDDESYLMNLVLALDLAEGEVADLVAPVGNGRFGASKRIFDVLFSGCFLLFAWPILLMIGLAVRWTSPGPALFGQRRFGKGGEEIIVWKFRSMSVSENGDDVKQATQGDSRITPLGAFMRRTSIDELPQFYNVLRGDMSVVGPRPHAVAHNRLYRTQILEYMLRHKVKPGITGLAQVSGFRGETDTIDKMLQRVIRDLEYIQTQSLWLDLQIVWRTVFGRGAKENAY